MKKGAAANHNVAFYICDMFTTAEVLVISGKPQRKNVYSLQKGCDFTTHWQ